MLYWSVLDQNITLACGINRWLAWLWICFNAIKTCLAMRFKWNWILISWNNFEFAIDTPRNCCQKRWNKILFKMIHKFYHLKQTNYYHFSVDDNNFYHEYEFLLLYKQISHVVFSYCVLERWFVFALLIFQVKMYRVNQSQQMKSAQNSVNKNIREMCLISKYVMSHVMSAFPLQQTALKSLITRQT